MGIKHNTTGCLLVCWEHNPPWVGTVEESFKLDALDDACPICGNTHLEDHLTDKEPEDYIEELIFDR